MIIYLDNCCFNRPFDDQKQIRIQIETEAKLYIQQEIIAKKLRLVWSYILDYENAANPYDFRQNLIQKWKDRSSIFVESNVEVVNKAKKLTDYNLHPKDALHLGCAIYANCEYFITTDDKIFSKNSFVSDIVIINPTEFVKKAD